MREPCDCYQPECDECNRRAIDQDEDAEMAEHFHAINQQEDRAFQRELDGGDDDDGDEEDPHGSHPIAEPDEVENEDEDEDEDED